MKDLIRVLASLLIGAALGAGLAGAMQRFNEIEEAKSGWTNYPTIADAIGTPVIRQHIWNVVRPSSDYMLFQGVLFGGGFGSIAGALLAVAAAARRLPT